MKPKFTSACVFYMLILGMETRISMQTSFVKVNCALETIFFLTTVDTIMLSSTKETPNWLGTSIRAVVLGK